MSDYCVYILKSKNYGHYYVGQTLNLKRRLDEHDRGYVYWTKRCKPWDIIYTEKFTERQDAIEREKYFKSHAGRNWLEKRYSLK